MSLTPSDLYQIRGLFEEYVKPIEGKLEALESDVKEIYSMIADLQKNSIHVTDPAFKTISPKERILLLHQEVIAAAKELGVVLPKS